MLTVAQICKEFAVDELTVRHWIRSGQLLAINVCRSPTATKPRWRVRRESIERFMATRSNRPAEAAPTKRAAKPAAPGGKKWF